MREAAMAGTRTSGFTEEERAAMRERSRESRARARQTPEESTRELLGRIAELEGTDRAIAEGLHSLVVRLAPHLVPKTWYGMPAYASAGKAVLFFQPASKFNARYATIGFNDGALLDDGAIWPTSFAVTAWTPAVEEQLGSLIARAAR
jgi:uncharacterized protein YdhG (YjbR/CyaY superfamily)